MKTQHNQKKKKKNLPSNAGDKSSIPGLGTKIPHAVETTKPMHHNYWALGPKLESNPHLLQLENACTQQQRLSTAKTKQINIF